MYLNFATFSNDSLAILIFCFCWRKRNAREILSMLLITHELHGTNSKRRFTLNKFHIVRKLKFYVYLVARNKEIQSLWWAKKNWNAHSKV